MNIIPLRYNISDWHQAVECLSNTSAELKIIVSDLIQNNSLTGLKLSVVHTQFGPLFSYVVAAEGDLVDPSIDPMPTELILRELARYGFDISYNQRAHLPGEQIQFLMILNDLHYDKIRLLTVVGSNGCDATTYVVAFKIDGHPRWLDNRTSVYTAEFNKACADGTAFNISTISEAENYRWEWLDYVANIDDIIRDNT